MYECVSKIAPSYFSGYFTSIKMIHNTGIRQSKKGDLYALRCNTTKYGIRSIHYSGVRMWNSLPSDIKASKSLSNFKKNSKILPLSKLQSIVFVIFALCHLDGPLVLQFKLL